MTLDHTISRLVAIALFVAGARLAHAQTPPENEAPPAATATAAPAAVPAATTAGPAANGLHMGTMGFQFVIPGGGGPTLGGVYFLNPMAALHVDLGLDLGLSGGTPKGFSIEGNYRLYLANMVHDTLMPFVQPGVFFSHASPNTSFALEGAVGAEYFLTNHLSIGIATGLAFVYNKTSGGPSITRIATGTSNAFAELLW